MIPAVVAAVGVAADAGYAVADPQVVVDSNHTLVWLRPHEIVAKVGRPSADGSLIREHAIGQAMARLGAPIAPPLPDVEATREKRTGLLVTLWQRFSHGDEESSDPIDVGTTLRQVHEALNSYAGELPSFLDCIESTRSLLSDDHRMRALNREDQAFLRATHDTLVEAVDSREFAIRRIHGEPHGRNRIATPSGARWIDFESACTGPLEWDLAILPEQALAAFSEIDTTLLDLLRTLHSARVAALCWERYEVPALQWHAEFHLRQLRVRSHQGLLGPHLK